MHTTLMPAWQCVLKGARIGVLISIIYIGFAFFVFLLRGALVHRTGWFAFATVVAFYGIGLSIAGAPSWRVSGIEDRLHAQVCCASDRVSR
jgi:hypothetical protein